MVVVDLGDPEPSPDPSPDYPDHEVREPYGHVRHLLLT